MKPEPFEPPPSRQLAIAMSPAMRKAVKRAAVDRDTTMSALVQKWIVEGLKRDGD